jgi:hypothetical protein
MQRSKLFNAIVLVMAAALVLIASSCFGDIGGNGGSSDTTTPAVVKPKPVVESSSATTSGTEGSYYTTLDISVKNNGSSGMVLVTASVTQNGKTSQKETYSFVKKGESRPFELTFPLVWKGGDFTYKVEASIP